MGGVRVFEGDGGKLGEFEEGNIGRRVRRGSVHVCAAKCTEYC